VVCSRENFTIYFIIIIIIIIISIGFSWLVSPSGPRSHHYRGFTITLRHTTLGRTPLDEWPVRRRDLYLTTHNTHNKQISIPPAAFEPTIPARERPQTHAIDRVATGIGKFATYTCVLIKSISECPSGAIMYECGWDIFVSGKHNYGSDLSDVSLGLFNDPNSINPLALLCLWSTLS
jgi:hypothetical protein